MTTLFVMLICLYHSLLRVIGKTLGLLFAGLLVGFMQGLSDVKDMYKYLAYRAIAQQKQKEKEKDGGENSDNDT